MMIGVIIQARIGSTRLPGKVLKYIGPKTLLEHILFRLTFLNHKTTIVIATSLSYQDNAVAEFCQKQNVLCFRGSEQHVLERFYLCARQYQFQHIIRLTGDNPFVDIEELDHLIDLHLHENADYSHSFTSLPIGAGAEIFTFEALERSYQLGKMPHHIEHVNEYILENLQDFKIAVLQVPVSRNHPEICLTVDTEADYQKACYIVDQSMNEYITTEEAIRLCSQYV